MKSTICFIVVLLVCTAMATYPGGYKSTGEHTTGHGRVGDRLSTDDVEEMQGMQIIISHHSVTAE